MREPACDPRELRLLTERGKGSSLGAPIVVDGRLWGEFCATRHVGDPAFDLDDSAVVAVETTFTPSDLFPASDRAQYVAKRGRLSSTVLADDFPPVSLG